MTDQMLIYYAAVGALLGLAGFIAIWFERRHARPKPPSKPQCHIQKQNLGR